MALHFNVDSPVFWNHNYTTLEPNECKSMPSLTLKNIPDDLYLQLKDAANSNHRSLNSEILYCVEKTLGTYKIDLSEHLETAKMLRSKTGAMPLTEDLLNEMKNEGRA